MATSPFTFWSSYFVVDLMCATLTTMIALKLSDDLGRHSEVGFLRALLSALVLYCFLDFVSSLGEFGFIHPWLALFSFGCSLVLYSAMAYQWTIFAELHLDPGFEGNRLGRFFLMGPALFVLFAVVALFDTDLLAFVGENGAIEHGILYVAVMLPVLFHFMYVVVHGAMRAWAEDVRSRRSEAMLLLFLTLAPIVSVAIDVFLPGTPVRAVGLFFAVALVFLHLQGSRILTDPLTGLNNRQRMEEYFEGRSARASQHEPFALCLVDVDGFKQINDTYGHIVGDQVLICCARALTECASRRGGFAARWGGDEFMLVVDAPREGLPRGLSDELNWALDRMVQQEVLNLESKPSFSVGMFRVDRPMSIDDAIVEADKLMYREKDVHHAQRRATTNRSVPSFLGSRPLRGYGLTHTAAPDPRSSLASSYLPGSAGYGMDVLTGLPSLEVLRTAIEGLREGTGGKYPGGPVLIAFDIENFKTFNNNYGFEGGDTLLRAAAGLLCDSFPGGLVIRLSEDHFFVLTGAKGVERRIVRAHERLHDFQRDTNIELKAGICRLDDEGLTLSTACDNARLACSSTKRRSEEFFRYYDEELGRSDTVRHHIVNNLDRALEEGWIKVYFQPVVRTLTGQVCGMEALSRWEDPTFGILGPDEFIPALEDYHLIHKLDVHVVRLACAQCRALVEEGKPMVPISVNLSRLDFELCDVTRAIEDAARDFDVPPSMIDIEVTESTLGGSPSLMREIIDSFQRLGFEVWMDDFGSGFSTLNSLKDYSFDLVKIDMLFLRGIETGDSTRSRTIIASIVDMAKKLGIQTLAEGVEKPEQLDFLRQVGCEKAQGFLLSQPLPLPDLMRVLEDKGLTYEKSGDVEYYDAIGRVNLLGGGLRDGALTVEGNLGTPYPLAVSEVVEGETIKVLAANASFNEFIRELGFRSNDRMQAALNKGTSRLHNRLADVFRTARLSRRRETIDFVHNGNFCNLQIDFIAEGSGRSAYLVGAINLSQFSRMQDISSLEGALRSLCSIYSRIDLLSLDGTYASALYMASTRYEPFIVANDSQESVARYARTNIHPDDQDAFIEFYDFATVEQRMGAQDSSHLASVFLTRDGQGGYTYQSYMLVPHIRQGEQYILSFVRDVEVVEVFEDEEQRSLTSESVGPDEGLLTR